MLLFFLSDASAEPFQGIFKASGAHLFHIPRLWDEYPTSVVSISHACGIFISRLWFMNFITETRYIFEHESHG